MGYWKTGFFKTGYFKTGYFKTGEEGTASSNKAKKIVNMMLLKIIPGWNKRPQKI